MSPFSCGDRVATQDKGLAKIATDSGYFDAKKHASMKPGEGIEIGFIDPKQRSEICRSE